MVVLALSIAPAMAAPQANAPVLPTVSFYSLSKNRVTLPADLKSERNLLLLYFQLTQQSDVDGWNTAIDHWRTIDPALVSYTSLVSPRKNFLSRWWQNASIRSASPDVTRWPTSLPLYVDKTAFERSLGISSENEVVLLLIDRQGRVVIRASGPPTESSRARIRTALQAAGAPASISATTAAKQP